MADTQGFETVVEATRDVLVQVLRGAWKSAECPPDPGDPTPMEEGRIPEHEPIPPGLVIGAFVVEEGDVHIPQEELDASFLPALPGAELKFGLHIQAAIQDSPVPSARLLEMTADLRTQVPIGLMPDPNTGGPSKNVGLLLAGLPRAAVSATLTSGDPLAGKLNELLTDYIHRSYENGAPGATPDPRFPVLPHDQLRGDQSIAGVITYNAFTELFDDLADPARRIETAVGGGKITISIPIHLKLFNLRGPAVGFLGLADPMGVETRLVIAAQLVATPGRYTVEFNAATAVTTAITPAGPTYGREGPHYVDNKAKLASAPLVSIDLDDQISQQIAAQGTIMARAFGARSIDVPTTAQIETAIADLFFADLSARSNIGIWTPESAGALLPVADVTPFVRADALVIAINASAGADVATIGSFVPAGLHFAIAIGRARLDAIIAQSRNDEGLAPGQLPKRFNQDSKDIDLKSLDVAVTDGAIRMTGMVTVIDAILDSIDVDADFTVNVGFHWEPNAALGPGEAPQMMKHHTVGEPDIDPHESVLLWVITVILAVISLGAGGVLLALLVVIVALIVRGIANNIGGDLVVDAVSGAVVGIGGWPRNLARIGRVRAVFHDPVLIEATGIVVAGTMQVISSCEATTIARAASGGPYTGTAGAALTLAAGTTAPTAQYAWRASFADPVVAVRDLVHVYPLSGSYIARHALGIAEPGGVTTFHYALVDIANVPPVLQPMPDLEVDEGATVTLVARFTDVEYADTHEAMWNFGDAQPPQRGEVTETNLPPRATGTVRGEHAWCTEGIYIVTLTLRDQNGGVAIGTSRVRVRNLPPTVEAGPDMFAYPCMVITVAAGFMDPGWCDRHVATWDFGACESPQTAVVEEINEPPAARGAAIASTIYHRCGTYRATCTVTDDAGASGSDQLTVQVVTLENPGFEEGYRATSRGHIANGWSSYVAVTRIAAAGFAPIGAKPSAPRYDCETCIVHDGQRSQRVQVPAHTRAGLHQSLGANPGWEYQVTAWVLLVPGTGGGARIGLDPAGGKDPEGAGLVWSGPAEAESDWVQLCVRGIATAAAVTIFLDIEGACEAWLDGVDFVARQPFCPPATPPASSPEKEYCATFEACEPGAKLGSALSQDGFLFESRVDQPLQIVAYGEPVGRPKLALMSRGITARPPVTARRVIASVSQSGIRACVMTALNAAGKVLAREKAPDVKGMHRIVTVAPSIAFVLLEGEEAGLVSLCAEPQVSAKELIMTISTDEPPRTPQEVEERMDPALRRALARRATDETVPVMISVPGRMAAVPARPADPKARRAWAEIAEEHFRREVEPLLDRLAALGATEIRPLWLCRGIAARLPVGAARALAMERAVERVVLDEPRRVLLNKE